MPSTPRGRNAATATAVVFTVLLALVWLRSSGDAAPSVPVGLPVETMPATVAEPADPTGLGQRGGAEAEGPSAAGEGERRGKRLVGERSRRHEHADRVGGDEDARAPRKRRARRRVGPVGQDPPATAPAPTAESGAAGGTVGSAPLAAPQPAPEFAIG